MTKQCTICGEEGEDINWHYGAISCIACKVIRIKNILKIF